MEKRGAIPLGECLLAARRWVRSRKVPWGIFLLVTLLAFLSLARDNAYPQSWKDEYKAALQHIQNKEWSEAVRALQAAIQGNSRDDSGTNLWGMYYGYYPHRELGIAYYHLGKLDLAREELRLSLSMVSTSRAQEFLTRVEARVREEPRGPAGAPAPRVATLEISGLPRGGKLTLNREKPREIHSDSLTLELPPEKEHTIEVSHPHFLPFKKEGITLGLGEKVKLPVSMERDDLAQPPATGVRKPDAVAVVIGNQNYKFQGVPRVDYAHRDAKAVKDHLIKTLGYREGNVILRLDATKGTFEDLFGHLSDPRGELFNLVKEGKSDLFIYYSGHGAPDIETREGGTREGYFVPVDANPNRISRTGYSVNLLNKNLSELLKERRPLSLTMVIDACFTGVSYAGSVRGGGESPVGIEVKNPLLLGPNVAVYTATQGTETASWFDKKRYGLFTYYFLRGLHGGADTEKDGVITHREMLRYLQENVSYEARRMDRQQTPTLQGRAEFPLM